MISPVSFGTLPLIADQVQFDIYQGELDMTQSLTTKLIDGDFASFGSSPRIERKSCERLGSEHSQRGSTLESWSSCRPDEYSVRPDDKPLPGQRVTMKTFWSNLGKREGTLSLSLWERRAGTKGPISPADNVEVTLERAHQRRR